MPVYRYRSIEEMPPPWREPGDPANLRAIAEMMTLHRRMSQQPRGEPGVTRFRSIEELKATKEPVQTSEYRNSRRPRKLGSAQGAL